LDAVAHPHRTPINGPMSSLSSHRHRFGGPVDFRRQTVALSTHSGWSNTPLTEILAARYGVPTVMDNDATSARSAEGVYGARARGFSGLCFT